MRLVCKTTCVACQVTVAGELVLGSEEPPGRGPHRTEARAGVRVLRISPSFAILTRLSGFVPTLNLSFSHTALKHCRGHFLELVLRLLSSTRRPGSPPGPVSVVRRPEA